MEGLSCLTPCADSLRYLVGQIGMHFILHNFPRSESALLALGSFDQGGEAFELKYLYRKAGLTSQLDDGVAVDHLHSQC